MRSAMQLLRELRVCIMTLKIHQMTQKAGKCNQSPRSKPRILLRCSVAKSEKMACANLIIQPVRIASGRRVRTIRNSSKKIVVGRVYLKGMLHHHAAHVWLPRGENHARA
jgi:hypothetical protein